MDVTLAGEKQKEDKSDLDHRGNNMCVVGENQTDVVLKTVEPHK